MWIARCLEEQGDLPASVDSYRASLELTTNPRRVIDLCNGLANVLLSQGDMDGAAAALARAEGVVPGGDGEEAARLRKAVSGMSAKRALQRARDKASRAHEDARKLEEEKGRKTGGRKEKGKEGQRE